MKSATKEATVSTPEQNDTADNEGSFDGSPEIDAAVANMEQGDTDTPANAAAKAELVTIDNTDTPANADTGVTGDAAAVNVDLFYGLHAAVSIAVADGTDNGGDVTGFDVVTGVVAPDSVMAAVTTAVRAIDRKHRAPAVTAALAPFYADANAKRADASTKMIGLCEFTALGAIARACDNVTSAKVAAVKVERDPATDLLAALVDLDLAAQWLVGQHDDVTVSRVRDAILTGEADANLTAADHNRVHALVTKLLPKAGKAKGTTSTGTMVRRTPAVPLPEGLSFAQAHVLDVVTTAGKPMTVTEVKGTGSRYAPDGFGNAVDNVGHPNGAAHTGFKPAPDGVTRQGQTFAPATV